MSEGSIPELTTSTDTHIGPVGGSLHEGQYLDLSCAPRTVLQLRLRDSGFLLYVKEDTE